MKFDVVGMGIATLDLNAKVPRVPGQDETVLMKEYAKLRGGPVATALVTLQKLGATTAYMGKLGQDEYGEFIREGFKEEGVNVDYLKLVAGEKTPFSFILVDATGKRSIIFNPGCSLDVDVEYLNENILKSAKIFHIDIYTRAIERACNLLKNSKTKISIDAGILFEGLEELLEFCDFLILPQEAVRNLTGEKDLLSAARNLIRTKNIELVVITCGAEGSLGITPNEVISKPSFKVKTVDTTGAGDVFHGAFLYGLIKGFSLEKNLEFSNAVAALKCTKPTGWESIPRLPEVEELMSKLT